MPPELEPFVLAIVVGLCFAWVVALRAMLRIATTWQRVWVWVVTAAGLSAGIGYAALIAKDLGGAPRTIMGTVESLGIVGDRARDPSYTVVVNGTGYWLKRADYQKLQIGHHIRGRAGAAFNTLQRVEVLPQSP